jgi:hypothetical protein
MPRRRPKPELDPNRHHSASVPAQEDEADILDEAGGVRDEGGELLVDEATVLSLGAVDAESVRTNRRMEEVVKRKRGGEKNITFNTDDLLTKYEELIQRWPPNTLDITVKRLTGPEVTHTITSRPRSGVELYNAIKDAHGQYEESKYEVKFWDTNQKRYRGTGRITMPDTRPPGQQGQQPMHYQPPPPPGYPPQQTSGYIQAPPGYPPQQAPFVAPTAPPSSDPMAMMGGFFELFQKMQAQAQPVPPPQPQFQAPPVMPPMPSSQASPAEQMAWIQQAFGIFQKMQQGAAPVQVAAPAPAPTPPPSPAGSMAEMMGMMTMMLEFVQKMQPPPPRPEFRGGPRPPYYPDRVGPPSSFSPDGQRPQQQQPQRQLSVKEQFQESIGIVRTAVGVIEEMDSLLPGRGGQQEAASMLDMDDDDNPIKIVDTGRGKLAVNKSDGALRWVETGMMALPDLLKWLGEQHQVIQEANKERQRPRRQLAPGYVEVGPGYQPPPGYDAVPVEEEDLPPPPEHMPPPVQEVPARRAWGAPVIPEQQEEN